MVATNLKAETMSLMETRTRIEEEMNNIIARLTAPGAPGIEGNLLDSKGFPRDDIDIPNVRASRQRLAVLRNDHKDITAIIEHNVQVLLSRPDSQDSQMQPNKETVEGSGLCFASSSTNDSTQSSAVIHTSENSPNAIDENLIVGLPFAVVDDICEGSPAALGGLMIGDQILKFGSVENGENLIAKLAREGQNNEGNEISVVVMRQGVQVHLRVTPRRWLGQGLLGFHLQII